MEIRRDVACWISKATRAQANASVRAPTPTRHPRTNAHACTRARYYIYLLLFHSNNGLMNAAHCYKYIACLVTFLG